MSMCRITPANARLADFDSVDQGGEEKENSGKVVGVNAPPVQSQPRGQSAQVRLARQGAVPDASNNAHGELAIHEMTDGEQTAGKVQSPSLVVQRSARAPNAVQQAQNTPQRVQNADHPDEFAEDGGKPVRENCASWLLRHTAVDPGRKGKLLVPCAHIASGRGNERGDSQELESNENGHFEMIRKRLRTAKPNETLSTRLIINDLC